MQPVGKSRGNGIELVKNEAVHAHVAKKFRLGRPYVMQRYLDSPLLIGERKWDMRLYVALTSVEPLQAYIYNEGFARFCTRTYDRHTDDMSGHLTNSFVSARQATKARPTAGECHVP
jgi:hypothetical protein